MCTTNKNSKSKRPSYLPKAVIINILLVRAHYVIIGKVRIPGFHLVDITRNYDEEKKDAITECRRQCEDQYKVTFANGNNYICRQSE